MQNSWGPWGFMGFAIIPYEIVNKNIVEAWGHPNLMGCPILESKEKYSCLSWKAKIDNVFGEEILDPTTSERIAWAFATRKGRQLVVDELFVWPTYRGHGFANVLVQRLQRLARSMDATISINVPWADCEPHKMSGTLAISRLLQVELRKSPAPDVGLVGTTCVPQIRFSSKKYERLFNTLCVPTRPECPRDDLISRQFPVFFGTNRACKKDGDKQTFENEIDSKTHYGVCNVTIPHWHRFGKMDEGWLKWRNRWVYGNNSKHEISSMSLLDDIHFCQRIKEHFEQEKIEEKDFLVFIHGYNVSFEMAAICAAQLGFDLKMPNTAFFSWPSQGHLVSYSRDEETVHLSADSIRNFIEKISLLTDGQIHIIGHSMGCRGILEAYSNLSSGTNHKIKNIILAAPDVNIEDFSRKISSLRQFAECVTIYKSKGDLALQASRFLHGYPRAGEDMKIAYSIEDVDVINVPRRYCSGGLYHSYFHKWDMVL